MTLKVLFPLKSAKFFKSDYKKVVYFTEILFGIFVTTAPSIVNAVLSNYGIVTFPPVFCGNSNGTYYFYTVVLPAMTTICLCGILTSLTLYKIHVVSFVWFRIVFTAIAEV